MQQIVPPGASFRARLTVLPGEGGSRKGAKRRQDRKVLGVFAVFAALREALYACPHFGVDSSSTQPVEIASAGCRNCQPPSERCLARDPFGAEAVERRRYPSAVLNDAPPGFWRRTRGSDGAGPTRSLPSREASSWRTSSSLPAGICPQSGCLWPVVGGTPTRRVTKSPPIDRGVRWRKGAARHSGDDAARQTAALLQRRFVSG